MSNLLKDNIIYPAWNIIKNDSKIKNFYIIPWFLSIIFLTILLTYQSIYTYVEIFWKREEALVIILKFFHSDYVLEVIITTIVFLIIYFIFMPIFEWWLIKYIDNKKNGNNISTSEAFWLWLYKFLPMFEYNNLFSEFQFISVLNGYLFSIRFIWIEYIKNINYIFFVILILSFIINILFAYSKYIMLIENKSIITSIWTSSKITILNLPISIKLYFLMFFLNIRVIINSLIFLSFPILIIISIWLITSKIFLTIAIIILTILFIICIIILWYLTAVLEIFKTAIWYYAYIEWKNKLEQIKEQN